MSGKILFRWFLLYNDHIYRLVIVVCLSVIDDRGFRYFRGGLRRLWFGLLFHFRAHLSGQGVKEEDQ